MNKLFCFERQKITNVQTLGKNIKVIRDNNKMNLKEKDIDSS